MNIPNINVRVEWRPVETDSIKKCWMCHELIFLKTWQMYLGAVAPDMPVTMTANQFFICEACHEILIGGGAVSADRMIRKI